MASAPDIAPHPVDEDAARIIEALKAIIEPLASTLPSDSEVVLHDLSRLPNSIVAVHGDVTGRRVGGPATDFLLRNVTGRDITTTVGYETRLPDGRVLRSTTILVPGPQGAPIAAMCINCDVTIWRAVQAIAEAMLPTAPPMADVPPPGTERAAQDIDELAQHLLASAVDAVGIPVDLMQKKHKIAVVQDLKDGGFFMLKESVEMVAQALAVTRFTIYNYLNELQADEHPSPEPA